MIKQAQLDWSDGTPISTEFSDVYFNKDNGAEESRYVFIEGNNLDTRWPLDTPSKDHFTIAETGFGTGLNFLSAWDLWLKNSKPQQRLHFLSVEKFPLDKASIIQALSGWPEFETLSQQLINYYPPVVEGWHTLHLPNPYNDSQSKNNGDVILYLYFGDVHDWLPQIDAQVDAWFLDGFAPSRNPDMWTDHLFLQMAKLTPAYGTVATFTAASKIQRGLKAAGFTVSKRKGYGNKREMVIASQQYTNGPKKPAWLMQQPWLESRHDNFFQNKTATIIGAGIAGCSSAYALAKRGWKVTLIERKDIASGASGNAQGVLYAKLSAEMNLHSQFYLSGYLLSLQYLKQQLSDKQDWNNCGVLQLATNDKEQKRQANFCNKYKMDEIVIPVNANEATNIAGCSVPYPGLFFKEGAWVYPTEWCRALIQSECITVLENTEVIGIEKNKNGQDDTHNWKVQCEDGSQHLSDVVIVCNANNAKQLPQLSFLPTKPVAGQVTQLSSQIIKLDTVLCGDHYVTPTHNQHLNFGASYRIKSDNTDILESENKSNITNLTDCFPSIGEQINQDSPATGRASVRCTTPDYTPIAGAICDQVYFNDNFSELKKNRKWKFQKPAEFYRGLYVNLGHGSRGLSSAPLCSDMIAAQITGEPLPLPKSQANIINPNRFMVNALIKQ
jgi:tRNA 5-methylaminomethyl-2-thiouridine biosynthesis bifunctional protein